MPQATIVTFEGMEIDSNRSYTYLIQTRRNGEWFGDPVVVTGDQLIIALRKLAIEVAVPAYLPAIPGTDDVVRL
jgi:hypothetical protein